MLPFEPLVELLDSPQERGTPALACKRHRRVRVARCGQDGFCVLVLHSTIQNHHRPHTVLPNALRQVTDGVDPVPFRIDPFGALLERWWKQSLFAPSRECTNDDELSPMATSRQRSERTGDGR